MTAITVAPDVPAAPHRPFRRGALIALMALGLLACEQGPPDGTFSAETASDSGVDLLDKAGAPQACTGSNFDPYNQSASLCGGIGGLKPGSSSSCQEQICWAQSLNYAEAKIPATHFYEAGCRCVRPIEGKFPHLTAVKDPGVVADLCGNGLTFIGDTKMVVSTPYGRHNCLGLIQALKAGAFTETMTRQMINAARPVCCAKDQPPVPPPGGGDGGTPSNPCARAVCDRQGKLHCSALDVLDVTFYKNKYPDLRTVFGNDVAALQRHYLNNGIREGRQPNAFFSPKTYLVVNPDVAKAYGSNNYTGALNHWITYGMRACRPLK